MTSHSRRSIEKEKTSHVFTGLRRRAFQAQACITTWSWTCCSTALIIVSPLTDRNRSEVWLLPECKQSCSLRSFLFFISLPSPHRQTHIQVFCHTLQQRHPPCCLNWEHAKARSRPASIALFRWAKTKLFSFDDDSSEKTKTKTKTHQPNQHGEYSNAMRIYSHLLSTQLTFKV